jgi:hypothetical protein
VVGTTRKEAGEGALRCRRLRPLRDAAHVIENLPRKLSMLDDAELGKAKLDRDERMSLLFRSWPSLSKIELRELRTLSDERQRLAKYAGALRGLHALRDS